MASGLMTGKRGLIMGVANDKSIAWGIAQACHAEGAGLAFTYQGEALGRRVQPLAASVGSDIVLPCDVTDEASLDAVELFEHLDDAERKALAQAARRTPFGRAEVITRQGAKANWLYVLSKGEVEVRIASPEGDKRVAVLKAPSFFGEMALMTGQPREATVVALTEVECLRIDKADFQGILQRRPAIAERISEILATRRVELDAAREGFDPEAHSQRLSRENVRILRGIKDFFGL